MMNQTFIQKTKWFWPWQDNQEEAWLEQMSKQGLHLKQAHFMSQYDFVKGQPETYTYRLDFQNSLKWKNNDEYLRLFADAGWEHLGVKGGWQYFRKLVKSGEGTEIFTDPESKIQKYNRYLTFLGLTYPSFLVVLVAVRKDWPEWIMWLNVAVILFFSIFAITFSVKISQRIKQLKML